MPALTEIIKQQHAQRAVHDDPVVDALMAELLVSLEEICVLRDRLDTSQRLLADGVDPSENAIDTFVADAALTSERLAAHRCFYEAVFGRLNTPAQ